MSNFDLQKEPKLFNVIIYKSPYITKSLLIEILLNFFNKNDEEASKYMLDIYSNNKCNINTYTYDIALTKKIQTEKYVNKQGVTIDISIEEVV